MRDLKSRNGTLVNGDKITGDKRLRNGDTLDVGPLKFEVIIEQRAPVEKELPAKKANNAEGAGKGSGDKAMGGMVSQWLEEADDVAREEQRIGSPETREYRFDETSRIELDQAAVEEAAKKETAALEVEAEEDGKKKKKAKKEPTKLPKFEVKTDAPKDTHEAAQQVLRKLFNRG